MRSRSPLPRSSVDAEGFRRPEAERAEQGGGIGDAAGRVVEDIQGSADAGDLLTLTCRFAILIELGGEDEAGSRQVVLVLPLARIAGIEFECLQARAAAREGLDAPLGRKRNPLRLPPIV